jgi:glycosyltransferase involved in cell wall biosynthesis
LHIILAVILLAPALLFFCTALVNALAWPRLRRAQREWPGMVAVLIPARNEAANIGACLAAVVRQNATVAEIIVCDDHSTDATANIVNDYARRDARVRLVTAETLPPGWCGKNFACARLADEARAEWLLFLDADARLADDAAARLIDEAQTRGVTLLSGWPALKQESFWEKVLMPMLNYVTFALFPTPLSLLLNNPSLGLVHGACILAQRTTYYAIGGHAAVRGDIFEDQRLVRLWRTRGERSLCLDGQDVVAVRMYNSLAEIWAGFRKNFFPAFRHTANFWGFLLLHATTLAAPLIALATQARSALIATAALLSTRLVLALRYQQPLWPVLLHPLAVAFMLALGLTSWWRCRHGGGVEWKGRVYQQPGSNA